jgi:GTP pyrophosphokinase
MSDSERLIEVEWGEEVTETYPVHVEVEALDRPGLMRDITSVIAEETINMSAATMYTHPKNHMAKMMLTLQISDVNQLSRVLARIARLPNVVEAVRQTH